MKFVCFDPAECDSNLEFETILLGYKRSTVPGAVSTHLHDYVSHVQGEIWLYGPWKLIFSCFLK